MINQIKPPIEKYRGQLLRVMSQRVVLPNSKETDFEYVERMPGVRVLVTNGSRILIVKEWRFEINDWDFRLPGGKVFENLASYIDAKNESAYDVSRLSLLAAQRELNEETGLDLSLSQFLETHVSIAGATIVWNLHYFIAKISDETIELKTISTDEGEQITIQWLTIQEVKELCLKGYIQEDRTVAVLLRYILNNEK